jgi:phage shock protein PspC (stress-responsive transcriptional regulator)
VTHYDDMALDRPLRRSRRHRVVAGVCGGLADWLGWDVTLVRILYVAVSLLSTAFPGILVYLVLWVLIPEQRESR